MQNTTLTHNDKILYDIKVVSLILNQTTFLFFSHALNVHKGQSDTSAFS